MYSRKVALALVAAAVGVLMADVAPNQSRHRSLALVIPWFVDEMTNTLYVPVVKRLLPLSFDILPPSLPVPVLGSCYRTR